MSFVGLFLYALATQSYFLMLRLVAFTHPKARLYVDGRKNLIKQIEQQLKNEKRQMIWFHCASLGEFEQARPLMERVKKENSNLALILTFFSPSGYEYKKNYPGADYIFYLPDDGPRNAARVVGLFNPVAAVFTKYEFWYYYLSQLKKQAIPCLLISASFRPNQLFFKWYGQFYLQMLRLFNHIFTQNQASVELLTKAGITHCSMAGDTRFDRVWETAQQAIQMENIAQFKNNHLLLVAGSSYAEEEKLLAGLTVCKQQKVKLVIAPHQIAESRIREIEQTFAHLGTQRFSDFNPLSDSRVLIIDNIGLLATLYSYADMALVGGGFGHKGLHNILEPATFGIPVMYGPLNHDKFMEAKLLQQTGGGFVVQDFDSLDQLTQRLTNDEGFRRNSGQQSAHFIQSNTGASVKILQHPVFNSLLYKK